MTYVAPDFSGTIARLDALSRSHFVFFRIEVGRLLLEDLYGGDPAAYFNRDPNKPSSLAAFVHQHGQRLTDIGLGEQVLRQSIVAHITYTTLPAEIRDSLPWSHLVELSRIGDTPTRRSVALAAADAAWTSQDLRLAAARVRAGLWLDGDPNTPGIQPVAPPPEPEPSTILPLGRVVTRFEKAADEVNRLTSAWGALPSQKLSRKQKERMRESLGRLQAQIAAMEAQLGEGAEE
jgi:hypothetical protein